MTPLINAEDKKVLAGSDFVKNAIFYKDMLAFYDAYEKIVSYDRDLLPNYCFNQNNTYLLDGICLLMKNYASEFGFETIKLSLEYLKVLYYTIVGYSTDENLPPKDVILNEVESYKKASLSLVDEEKKVFDEKNNKFLEAQKDYDKFSSKYAKELVSSKVLGILAIVMLTVFMFAAGVSAAVFFLGAITSKLAIILVSSFAFVAIFSFIIMKAAVKKIERKAGDVSYVLQNKKKNKDALYADVQTEKVKLNRILVEKYEYKSNFAEELNKYTKRVSFDEIIKRASEYKLLSYNLKVDIANLFENQRKEVQEVLSVIDGINPKHDAQKSIQSCYRMIKDKDWLFFNNEIRYSCLRKFADTAEITYDWKIEDEGKMVNPFGINVKGLAKEKITYLKSKDHLFVSASLDKFLNTNFIKNTKALTLKGLDTNDSIKNMKVEYLTKFFDYESTKSFNNLFYDKKLIDGVKISDDIIEKTEKIPTFVNLKLKMVESKLGLTNGDSSVIKQIASDILKVEESNEMVSIIEPILDQNLDSFAEEENAEDFGDYIRYSVGGDTFIGYKI